MTATISRSQGVLLGILVIAVGVFLEIWNASAFFWWGWEGVLRAARLGLYGGFFLTVGVGCLFFARSQRLDVDRTLLRLRQGPNQRLAPLASIVRIERGVQDAKTLPKGARNGRRSWWGWFLVVPAVLMGVVAVAAGLGSGKWLGVIPLIVGALGCLVMLAFGMFLGKRAPRTGEPRHYLRVQFSNGKRLPIASSSEAGKLDRLQYLLEHHIAAARPSAPAGSALVKPTNRPSA